MENEEFKSIKIALDYIDESNVASKKVMTVKVGKLKSLGEKGFAGQIVKSSYSISFTLVIPDHIHKAILGQTVPGGVAFRPNEMRTFDNYPKSITRETLSAVCDEYWEVIKAYRFLKNADSAGLVKVIFYDFDLQIGEYKSTWNGLSFGNASKMAYKYAIGYVSGELEKQARYNSKKQVVNKNQDRQFYSMDYIEWSEDREAFFVGINSSFESIIAKLSEFNENLTEDTINSVISSGMKLLK